MNIQSLHQNLSSIAQICNQLSQSEQTNVSRLNQLQEAERTASQQLQQCVQLCNQVGQQLQQLSGTQSQYFSPGQFTANPTIGTGQYGIQPGFSAQLGAGTKFETAQDIGGQQKQTFNTNKDLNQ